ncbi:MAG: FixH family protein [Phycisphaerae bacterium]
MTTIDRPVSVVRNLQRHSRKPAIFWGTFICSLLLLEIGLCTLGVCYAVSGAQVVVEADYYNKALHWDDHLALQQASLRLGWKTSLELGNTVTTAGERAVILHITDRDGKPIENAQVDVGYFHHARPAELHTAVLKASAPGTYTASVPLNRAGTWEFRISAAREKDRFIEVIQQDLNR